MKSNNKYCIILFSLLFLIVIDIKAYKPTELINPNISDRRHYVADPDGLVGAQAKDNANSVLWLLRKKTGAEVVVAVVNDIEEYSPEDFSTALFEQWGIGKKDKDNGVLVLIVPSQRIARIATGYGVEGIIPDISARKIIGRSIVPYMKENDLDGAVVAVSQDISNILTDPVAAEELKSKNKEAWEEYPESDVSGEDLLWFIFWVVIGLFLVSTGKYFYDSNRLKKLDRYRQALGWHNEINTYLVLAIVTLGLGLLPYWLAKKKYKKARNNPMTCPACKGYMTKLNEEDDNNFLSPSQDFEEKINTVDYDVWVCDQCGTIERYPFRIPQNKYEECPNCLTIALCMVRDHTVIPATTKSSGVGEKLYECKYCHHQKRQRYTIPKKNDPTVAAIAAGSALGSGRGGGFGGGFGGGHTGGGGATGRW